MPSIIIYSGHNAGETYSLRSRETIIGRDASADIPLKGHTISRKHARIVRQDDSWEIEDLGSVNGTWLNGEQIAKRTPLRDQDQIGIYDTLLLFSVGNDTVSAKLSELKQHALSDPAKSANIVSSLDIRDHDSSYAGNAADKLNAILEITRSMSGQLKRDALLSRILESLFRIFPQADRGYILQESSEGKLHPVAIQQEGESDTINPAGGEIANRVMEEGVAFLSADAVNDKRIEELSESIFDEGIRSVICAPLMGPSHVPLGVIHLETSNHAQPFNQDDLAVLASVAIMGGQALEYSRLHKDLVELERNRTQLKLAHDVQMQSLQQTTPDLPGYEFFHHYEPAESVAGDFYEYVELSHGRMAIALGDVAGKGISAALLVARLLSEVRYVLQTHDDPAEAITKLNALLIDRKFSSFVTLLLLMVDPRDHSIAIVNAGHMNPFHIAIGGSQTTELTQEQQGLPLVASRDSRYAATKIVMNPGETVLAFTDGVSDAMNPAGETFGIEAIKTVAAESDYHARHKGQALASAIRTFKSGEEATGDVCIFCISRNE